MRNHTRSFTLAMLIASTALLVPGRSDAQAADAAHEAAAYGYAFGAAQDLTQVDPDGLGLKPGEFAWLPGADENSSAPVTLLVSLRDQRGYLYREGRRIAVTTVSTGRPGHDTPQGVFPIMGKSRIHYSNRYDDAPMPWMQRLTNWGHALHAGDVRPTPASHGCVRLPAEFAEQLFSLTRRGDLVVISQDVSPRSVAIALAIGRADSSTAQRVGITQPLPRIILVPREQQGPSERAARVGAESVSAF
jgi:lipoprotein-anchoring transpeptidase ErfK/SrfK